MLYNVDCDISWPAAVNEPPKLIYLFAGYSFIECIIKVKVAFLMNRYILI